MLRLVGGAYKKVCWAVRYTFEPEAPSGDGLPEARVIGMVLSLPW